MLDLITFTLTNGMVLRYNSGCYVVNVGGVNYAPAALEVGSIKQALGTDVDDVTMNWYYDSSDKISGVLVPSVLRSGVFDYAVVNLSHLFMTEWSLVGNPAYVLQMFAGLLQQDTIGRSKAELRVKAMTDKLSVQIPSLIYQPGCMNILYDSATCGVNRANFAVGSAVGAGSNQLLINCGLGQAAGYFSKGSVHFTSGMNNGVVASVQKYAPGQFSLMWPLPFIPQAGDTFIIVPGCDRTISTCQNVFGNYSRYRGTPFIPTPSVTVS